MRDAVFSLLVLGKWAAGACTVGVCGGGEAVVGSTHPAEGVSLRAVGAVLVVGGFACFEEGAAFFSLTLELFGFVLGEEVLH